MVSITSGVESWAQDVQSENARSSRVSKVELGYDPFPKQQEFHASPAKYRLFGGAAGPGKSKALLMEAILQAHDASRREHAAAAPHVSRARAIAAPLFSPRRSARALQQLPTNRSTWSPGRTAPPRASATVRANTTFTSIRARNFFSSASTSSRFSPCASGNFSPAATAVPCPARFRAWPARPIPATSATPG